MNVSGQLNLTRVLEAIIDYEYKRIKLVRRNGVRHVFRTVYLVKGNDTSTDTKYLVPGISHIIARMSPEDRGFLAQ